MQPCAVRPTCYLCFRPKSVCYCDVLPLIDNHTRVIVVQHPRERFHPLNTARLAARSLKRCELIAVPLARLERELSRVCIAPEAALLFPDRQATDLEDMEPPSLPREVVILDGTWHQAKTLLRDVPALQGLRRVRFTPRFPSAYRIRKEPHVEYVSTVEAIFHVLSCLEPQTAHLDQLNSAFASMIERNVARRPPAIDVGRFVRNRRCRPHRFPQALNLPPERIVLLYAEGMRATPCENVAGPGHRGSRGKQPLVVCAKRVSGNSLTVLLKPTAPPSPQLLAHLSLTLEDLEQRAVPRERARHALENFISPQDAVIVVNASSIRILEELGVRFRASLELKGVYCDFQRYLAGTRRRGEDMTVDPTGFLDPQLAPVPWEGLEGALERHEIVVPSPLPPGRAATRLVQTTALFMWLRKQREIHLRALS